MSKTKRVLGTLGTATLVAGGIVIGTAGAASAAPECRYDGVSVIVLDDGSRSYQYDARCGELYQYEQPAPPVVSEEPVHELEPIVVTPDPAGWLPWACEGVVASVICDNWYDETYLEENGDWYFNHDAVPAAPEEVPEGNVDVGEPEPMPVEDAGGGGFSGGYGGGGGFFGGGGFGGGGSTGGSVSVGDAETIHVETVAQ